MSNPWNWSSYKYMRNSWRTQCWPWAILETDPLTSTWETPEELNADHSMVIWHSKQIGKVKKLSKRVPHKQTKIQKIVILKCCLKSTQQQTSHFSIGLWCVMKSGFYTTTGSDQLSGWTEKFWSTSQSQTCTKKGHGHCLVVCCPSGPLQLSESWQIITSEKHAQQIDERHWKLQGPQLALVNRKGPILLHDDARLHNQTPQKAEQVGLRSFASSAILTWPLANRPPLLQGILRTFCRENASTTSRRQKMLSMSSSNPGEQVFTP